MPELVRPLDDVPGGARMSVPVQELEGELQALTEPMPKRIGRPEVRR
jgi:hypothetical protein